MTADGLARELGLAAKARPPAPVEASNVATESIVVTLGPPRAEAGGKKLRFALRTPVLTLHGEGRLGARGWGRDAGRGPGQRWTRRPLGRPLPRAVTGTLGGGSRPESI